MTKYVIVTEDPLNGIKVYGDFDSATAAITWAFRTYGPANSSGQGFKWTPRIKEEVVVTS